MRRPTRPINSENGAAAIKPAKVWTDAGNVASDGSGASINPVNPPSMSNIGIAAPRIVLARSRPRKLPFRASEITDMRRAPLVAS